MSKGLGLSGMIATGHQDVTIWHMRPEKVQLNNAFIILYRKKQQTPR